MEKETDSFFLLMIFAFFLIIIFEHGCNFAEHDPNNLLWINFKLRELVGLAGLGYLIIQVGCCSVRKSKTSCIFLSPKSVRENNLIVTFVIIIWA